MAHFLTPKERAALESARESLSCSLCDHLQTNPHYLACGHSFCENCLNQALGARSACPDQNCGQLTGRKDITKFHAQGTLVASFDRFRKFLAEVPPPISPAVLPVNEFIPQIPMSAPVEEENGVGDGGPALSPGHVLVEGTCREEEETPISPYSYSRKSSSTAPAHANTARGTAGAGAGWQAPGRRNGSLAVDRRVVPDSMAADREDWRDCKAEEEMETQTQTETQTETETEKERASDSTRVLASRDDRVRIADTYDSVDFYGAEEEEEERGKEEEEEEEVEDFDEGTLRETSSSENAGGAGAGCLINDEMSGSERDAAANMARLVAEIEQELAQVKARKRRRRE